MLKLVVFDLETTGADCHRDEIIEFGALIIENGQVVDRKQFLIRPERGAIPWAIQKLTGITDADVENAKPFSAHRQEILSVIGKGVLVAHNAQFDLSFLERSLGVKLANEVWDTWELARIFFPYAGKYDLSALARYLQLALEDGFRFHRALNDAWVSWQILERCWQKGLEYDLGFYIQTRPLVEGIGSGGFFKLLEREIIKSYPQRPIKTGIVTRESEHLFQARPEPSLNPPAEPEWVGYCFAEHGLLAQKLSEFESRPGQKLMAEQVTSALCQSRRIVIEAGTGIGKTFAYLVPGLWWARRTRRRVVVATHTIPLQEQIFHKDLPVLREILPFSFRSAILKGRGNYLCLKNWLNLQKSISDFSVAEKILMLGIHVWLRETQDGDLQELANLPGAANLWYLLSSENDCMPQKCPQAAKCFLLRARERAEAADLIVVNHSLLLADLKTEFNILPDYGDLIIDEAHHFHQAALNHLGWELSLSQITRLVDGLAQNGSFSLYHSAKRRLVGLQGVKSTAAYTQVLQALDELPPTCEKIGESAEQVFELLSQLVDDQTTLRLKPADQDSSWWQVIKINLENLCSAFRDLLRLLKEIHKFLAEQDDEPLELLVHETQGYRRQVEEIVDGLFRLMQIEDRAFVRWIEIARQKAVIKMVPVEVSAMLYERLFSRLQCVIFTSATLSVGGQFNHFLREVGLPLDTDTLVIDSPFNYDEQMRFLVVEGLAPQLSEEFVDQVADFIGEVAQILNKRILVLFTSHHMLRAVYERLQLIPLPEVNILAQGIEGSRGSILDEFVKSSKAILLGAYSFWEGIDLPGDLLSCVIMIKLPFSPPTLPLIEARSELLQQDGKNPFQELLLPEAVIKFKQGFGRLIRRKSDKGFIILLDARILYKSYGKLIFSSLPLKSYFRGNIGYILRKIEEWSDTHCCP